MSAWSTVRSLLGLRGARSGGRGSLRPTFRPTLELLEARLPPGDMLSALTGAAAGLTAPAWASGDLSSSADKTSGDANAASTDLGSATEAATAGAATAAPGASAAAGGASRTRTASQGLIGSDSTDVLDQLALSPAFQAQEDATGNAIAPPPGFIPPELRPTNAAYIPHYSATGTVTNNAVTASATTATIPLTNASWTLIGPAPVAAGQVPGTNPVSGRVTGIAADPTNANIIYLATAGGGVWKTTDGGGSWAPLTDAQPTLFMGAIAVAPSSPNVIYAGTGEANNSIDSYYGVGVLKSTDGGATWTVEDNGGVFSRKVMSKVVVDPTDANTLYVAVAGGGVNGVGNNNGVWKSTDGGATWTNTTTGISGVNGNSEFSDLVINPTNPSNLFCAIGQPFGGAAENGVYVTSDGGATWAAAGNFNLGTGDGNIKIDISASNPLVVYAAVADPTTFAISFIAKTTDGGATWNNTTAPPNYLGNQGWYDSTIAVDPTNSNVVFVGGQQDNTGANHVEETTDGGNTWNDISVGVSGIDGPHTDHHAMTFDANGLLLDGNDGGIWRLQDPTPGAVVWQDLNAGLSTLQAEGIALDPTTANVAYMGTQDNGTDKFTGSLPWSQIQGGDGGFVRVDPTNPLIIYHTFSGDATGFIERSMDGGATWTDISAGINSSGNEPSDFYVPYQMDQSNPARLILGTDHLYETTDRGASWHVIATPGTAGFAVNKTIDAIGLSQSAPNTIYVGDDQGNLFVTNDDGATWTQRNIPAVTDHINELVVDPANANSVYAVRDRFGAGKVFHSTDGGTTWTDISGNLPDLPTYAFALNTAANTLYVGNDNGVFASTDGGASWAPFGTGLPNAEVRELQFNASLAILAAGTHGRSMWEISTAVVTPPPPPPPPPPTPVLPAIPLDVETNQTSDAAFDAGVLLTGQSTTTTGQGIGALPDGHNDYDWFRWEIGVSGTFSVAETTTAAGSLEVHLFALQGNTLVEIANNTTPGVPSVTLSAAVAAGETVLVEIKGHNSAVGVMDEGIYDLTASLT